MAARAGSTGLTSCGSAAMTGFVLELDNCLQGQQNDFLYPKEKAGQAGDGARKKIPITKWSKAVGSGPSTTQSRGRAGLTAGGSPSGRPEKAPVWESGGFSLCSNFTAGYCYDLGAGQINPAHFCLTVNNRSGPQP